MLQRWSTELARRDKVESRSEAGVEARNKPSPVRSDWKELEWRRRLAWLTTGAKGLCHLEELLVHALVNVDMPPVQVLITLDSRCNLKLHCSQRGLSLNK